MVIVDVDEWIKFLREATEHEIKHGCMKTKRDECSRRKDTKMKEIIIVENRPKCKHSVIIEEMSDGYICALALHLNPCKGYFEDRKHCPSWRGID